MVGAISLVHSPEQEVKTHTHEKRNLIGSHDLAASHPQQVFLDTTSSGESAGFSLRIGISHNICSENMVFVGPQT